MPPTGEHGGDAVRIAGALGVDVRDLLDLSQSMNPVAPDPTPVISANSGAVHRYPDLGATRAIVAEVMGVDPDALLLTNGGAEAIALVARLVGRGWVDGPEFSLYARHLTAMDPTAGRWRSNPNNPIGRLAAPEDRAAVWDEAFYALSTGRWTRGDVADGALVVGSFTKLLACPGLRIGYVLAKPQVVHRLSTDQPAWSVSTIAAESLPELLAAVDLELWSAEVARLRAGLVDALRVWGAAAVDSDAPWVLVEVGDASAYRAALALQGVVVRDCSSFGLPAHLRIAVPAPGGLARLEEALASVEAPPVDVGESEERRGPRSADDCPTPPSTSTPTRGAP